MTLGEICFLTNDVVGLANFYKSLLNIDNDSNDDVHQKLISEETMLTIYNDGSKKNNLNQNICVAFTCEDINIEFEKLKIMGVNIIEEPKTQPWGSTNMSFFDPDGNTIYLRSIPK